MGLMSVIDFMLAFMNSGKAGSHMPSITVSTGKSNVCFSSNRMEAEHKQ
jgi:hypothetical protein